MSSPRERAWPGPTSPGLGFLIWIASSHKDWDHIAIFLPPSLACSRPSVFLLVCLLLRIQSIFKGMNKF